MSEISLSGIDFWKMASLYIEDGASLPGGGCVSSNNSNANNDSTSVDSLLENIKREELKEEPKGHQPGDHEHASPPPSPLGSSWLTFVVSQLSTWLTTNTLPDLPEIPLEEIEESESNDIRLAEMWSEWEWILSETEKVAIKRSAEETERVKLELELLRKNANLLRMRPLFVEIAREIFATKTFNSFERYKLERLVLDASKRSKIICDVINSFADTWLQFIKLKFFQEGISQEKWKMFADAYGEAMYHKGVVGGMKELGWQASHGPGDSGLTDLVLGEIGWAIWKTLNSSIRWTLERELSIEENEALAKEIGQCFGLLIDLWYSTLVNSELGASREGVLPAKWAEEALREKERLELIKKAGVSARYEYKPVSVRSSERKKLKDLKKFLESQLQFRRPG